MDNNSFARRFYFTAYTRDNNYQTDNRAGATMHFFGYMLEGYSHFESESESFDVKEGELVYIPMHIPYHSYWYGSPTVRFISLGFGLFPDTEQKHYRLQKIVLDEESRKILLSIPLNGTADCDGVSKLYSLLGRLLPNMTYNIKKPADLLVERATEYMSIDPELSIGKIAKRCGVSESGLYAAFRAEGTTPVGVRQRILCEKAINLLMSTNFTVEDISDKLGFSTPAYFRRVLKKQYGKTPKDIRRDAPV